MEIDNPTLVAIVSAIIAALALFWAIYTHFSTRKISKLTYEISQLSDFGVPESFLKGMPHAPIAITLTSRGNKCTENIILDLKTWHDIEDCEIIPPSTNFNYNENQLKLEVPKLNPSQQIKLFIRCSGIEAQHDQIQTISVSHSDGAGVNEKELKSISFNIMGIELEYNLQNLTTSIIRLGPIVFK